METLQKIAEMAKVKSWHEIMDNFILPEVLKSGGSARGYVISDEFMTVVAEFGPLIHFDDAKTAEVLLEFAMQRISCGAVKHPYLGTALNVPQRYVYYSTFQDKPAPMSDACFDFLLRGFPYCFSSKKLRKHAEAILFGLIFNLDYKTGEPLNGFDLSQISTSSQDVKKWAWETAKIFISFDDFWKKLISDSWFKYRDFFINNRVSIDVNEFHKVLVARYPPQKIWRELAKEGWEYHIGFFHDYWPAVDTKEFFSLF